jgi:hypothetical protein
MSEIFSVGDMVTYTASPLRKTLQCKVIKVMPVEHAHAIRSYRVRDSAEAFDRAVPEFTLTRIEPSALDKIFKS